MAAVYRATDRVLGRTVAVKILAPHYADDPGFVARFRPLLARSRALRDARGATSVRRGHGRRGRHEARRPGARASRAAPLDDPSGPRGRRDAGAGEAARRPVSDSARDALRLGAMARR